MLIELLKRGGTASILDVAKALVGRDKSQVEYYEHITKNMVGRLLTNSRGITHKEEYSLIGFDELSSVRFRTISHCENKIGVSR